MKKVIYAIILIVILGFAIYFIKYYTGGYIPLKSSEEINAMFFVKDGEIYIKNNDNKTQITIKGVNLDNFIPGHSPSDYAITKSTWTRWFNQISGMGANTIKINNIYDPTFYDAFYEYNSKADIPLYLIQGITVSDYANDNANDAYANDFYRRLLDDGRCAVDIIHGQRNVIDNNIHGSGRYRADVSKWVIGYIVGSEWNSATIAYTNNKNKGGAYRGNYLSTIESANAFELMLCKVMDNMVNYESKKYHTQRLISFTNDPAYDPFIYDEGYDLLYNKYVDIDIEVIKQRHFKGLFSAYSAYELCNDYDTALSERTKNKLHNMEEITHKDAYLHGYIEILSKYHNYPVVVTSFNCSTARGVITGGGPYTETQQGQLLVETYNNIISSGAKGAFIEGWQDSWIRHSSNTLYGINTNHSENWHDMQTTAQNKGILAFEPGNKYNTVYLDGDFNDFIGTPQVGRFGDCAVSYSYDANYIYFLITGPVDFNTEPVYLAFDITPNSGAFKYTDEKCSISFDRGTDFILKIDGKDNTKLLVQERYDGFKANYTDALLRQDVFANPPAKDSEVFNIVGMLRQTPPEDVSKEELSVDEYLDVAKVSRYDTGNFRHGITNPSSSEFDSLSDFYIGNNGVEIRIPWTLLNFSDPSHCLIHKDYYECFGREDMKIAEFYVATYRCSQGSTKMMPVKLSLWTSDIKIEERLKTSYEIIRKAWNGIG